jgi:hypothetical protein
MAMLHEPAVLASLTERLKRLTPASQRQWGKMTVDQMLWHLNEGFEMGLGRRTVSKMKVPLPRFLLRFLIFNVPWPKGKARTHPDLEARATYDFETERARTVSLLGEVASRPLEGAWPDSYSIGRMSGRDWSRLGAIHVDYHLKQFGV